MLRLISQLGQIPKGRLQEPIVLLNQQRPWLIEWNAWQLLLKQMLLLFYKISK